MRTVVSRLVSGRRYRFGRLAALVAGGHAALVVTFGAAAVVNGDARGLRRLMIGWERPDPPPNLGWYVLPLVLAGLAQSWALWRILRGRVIGLPALSEPSGSAGSPEPSGAVAFPGPIRALRAVLYLALAFSLLFLVWPRPPWWVSGLDQAGQLALVILFHRTLTGAFRGLRCTALAAGTLAAISVIGSTVSEEIGLEAAESVFSIAVLDGLPWLLWMSLVLVAQSQDGRWRRGTVWAGISYLVLVFIVSPLMFDLAFLGGFEDTVYGAVQAFSGNTMLVGAVEALSVTLPVWLAGSIHDLAVPPPGAVPQAGTVQRVEAVPRAPRGPWPLPVAAVALPLLPVVVNLTHGVPFWVGPRGPIRWLFDDHVLAGRPATLWLCFDAVVGCGGLALLVLAAVRGRTRRVVRVTAGTLLLTAAIGAAAVAAEGLDQRPFVRNITVVMGGGPLDYPDRMLLAGTGAGIPGVSPLWHSAALTVSAILLLLGYGGGPARRSPYRTAAAASTYPA